MLNRLIDLVKGNLSFVIVLLIAFVLRISNVDSLPPALNWDEVSHGYNAWSILKTAKDEWGKLFPIIFKAYGDFKLPVYIYVTALFEFVFGLNSWAVRLPSVLAGVGTVFFTYYLVRELFEKKVSGLLYYQHFWFPWSPGVYFCRARGLRRIRPYFSVSQGFFFF